MSSEAKPSKIEKIKSESHQLRGTISEELGNENDQFEGDTCQLLKHHGSYQQDHRDLRGQKNEDGSPKGKAYSCMVRTAIPGGIVTAEQFLAELDLCDRLGDGTLHVTTRQGLQLHGIIKSNLRETIREINTSKLTTLAACGDVCRNTMCCPAPDASNPLHREMQELADKTARYFRPKTTGYYEIWLEDEQGERENVAEFSPVEEPVYGAVYLPRKFKIGFSFPEDNCVDIYTHDLGFLAVVEQDQIVGYNVLVGGGMGATPSQAKTFPAVAKRMTFVPPGEVINVAEAVIKVQRDFGNRSDRKVARLKYLIANWGLEKFKAQVEEQYGSALPEPHAADVTDVEDHMGWHDQGDGLWYLGINIENGLIKDAEPCRMKTGLRAIVTKYQLEVRLTPMQSLILCGIRPEDKEGINQLLVDHEIPSAEELTIARRFSLACSALPMCGLAVTEAHRVMPECMSDIEHRMAAHGLQHEKISVRMTGCPNGCARPYVPDIGLVGKSKGKYTLFLGGSALGTRLAFIYRDQVPLEEIGQTLDPLFACFKNERNENESFGDFCQRKGLDDLAACDAQ